MASEITCKSCNYTRQPTDNAPEWACPQCQKVYEKTTRITSSQYCRNHPPEKTSWRCNDCGSEFCAACVTPHQHTMSHLSRSVPFATCPECRGMCIDFQYAEKLACRQLDEDKAERKLALRMLMAGVATIPIIALFMVFAPFELICLFLFFLLVVVKVLSWQKKLDDWIGGGSIFSGLYKEYHLFTPKYSPVNSEVEHVGNIGNKKIDNKFFDRQTTIFLGIFGLIMLSFPLRYYQGKQAGIADARRELPATVWHSYSLYTELYVLPIKNMPVFRHRTGRRSVSFYIQGYVTGHNEVVREWIQSNSSKPSAQTMSGR